MARVIVSGPDRSWTDEWPNHRAVIEDGVLVIRGPATGDAMVHAYGMGAWDEVHTGRGKPPIRQPRPSGRFQR